MAPKCFGWMGKILNVNLTTNRISELETVNYAELFLGGRGIATRIYWENVRPDVAAFDPENCLILMSGALVATGASGATRMTVMGKSPMVMPEGFCYGNLGGFFPAYLKRSGYDGIVITGCAAKPSYLWIHDDTAEIRDASVLWGKGTYEVQNILKTRHGNNVRFVTTGVCGENRCRNATVITDNEGSATGGFGAVMGSKNLKAIAVFGKTHPLVARKKELAELNKHIQHISKRGTLRMPMPKKKIEFVKTASCYQCGMECGRGLYRTTTGRQEIRKCQAMVMYMPFMKMRPEEPIDTALDATRICNDFSICTMELSHILLWLEACYQSGLLTDKDTGLSYSNIGSIEFLEQLVSMIAYRKGFGDILAEGILRAGKKLGKTAEAHFSQYTKAVGKDGIYSPKQYPVNAMLYALEPRQPIAQLHDVSHLIARWLLHRIRPHLSPTTAAVFRKAAVKFWKSEKAWDMTTLEGKAEAAVRIQDRTYVKDSLGLCDFGWPIMDSFNTEDHTGDPTLESKLFSAVTGIDIDEAGLDWYGERIFNQQRAILLREGWRPQIDDVPAEHNFTEPLLFDVLNPELMVPGPTEEPVSVKGAILDRNAYKSLRKEFYAKRNWDIETGLQNVETLSRIGLFDVAKALKESDLIEH